MTIPQKEAKMPSIVYGRRVQIFGSSSSQNHQPRHRDDDRVGTIRTDWPSQAPRTDAGRRMKG